MKTCPKCGYTRQPTDTAPDYECPKCGIVYEKYWPGPSGKSQPARAPIGTAAAAGAPEVVTSPGTTTSTPPPQTTPSTPPPADDRKVSAPPRSAQAQDEVSLAAFAERLRADSRYPTFRELVKIIYFIWMVLAALMALGGVVTLIRLWDFVGFGLFIGAMFFAVLFVVIARISRELSLMLVDLSDAAVRIASKVRP